ncbi:integrin alpha-PS2-like [Planococcus citri]|uniref:integrin alpha-PS2-like n=1 Tax=Planococcus citri TaxID=170843 RepID=UPI0031F74A8F
MCASDVNGDGADDLIIGAPMHANTKNDKDYEIGRIYVFYQGNIKCRETDLKCAEKLFARNETIDGVDSGARFGSALASLGDINKDGYEDIAVSAPYQGSDKYNTCASATRTTGAVYIYLGSENGLSKTPSQVIKASDVAHLRNTSQLSAFGHSLSGGLDLDKNQYPDLIVGAYEYDAVFLFKSRPVINLTASLSFLVKKTKRGNVPLDRNTCTSETKNKKYACVTLKICMQYSGVGVEDQIDISTNITLDTKYADTSRMRFSKTKNSTLKLPLQLTKNKKKCENETVYVDNKDPDIEKVTPLEASLQYELVESKNKKTLSSILNFGPTTRTDSFNISRNCGDDDICYPNLNLTVIPNITQYEPLSKVDSLNLQVLVKNNGEYSYGSRFILQVPKGLEFYTYENSPLTDKFANLINLDGENITFSIGNPLPENQKVNFSVILRINKTLEDLSSAFHFWAKVNSTNPEKKETLKDNIFLLDIPIREIVSLEISSASYITVRKDIEAGPEVIHQYIIKNSGTANLSEVSAIFFWPVKLTNGGDLLYLMEQPKTQGSIQCDYVANVNYKNLTKIRAYKNTLVIPWVKNSNDAKPRRSTNQTTSEDTSTSKNPVSNNSTDYQKIRCTIRNLSREEEVSVLFPSVVWMETIEQIAGFRNKSLEIGSWVEVNVTTLSRNVTQIPEKPYRNEAITTIEFEKAYIEEAIPAIIKSREPDVIPLWSVVRSCVLGVLILMSMICGLYKLGFFKRNRPPTFSAAEEACQESDLIVKMGKSSCDEMDVENAQATKEMERRVNQMCMETITLRQCIKKIVIENEIELDEKTLNMLKLPNVTIEYGPISNTGILIDTSPDTEYLVPIDHKWEFPRSNLSFGKCLGVGEFGKVVAAEAFGILHQNVTSTVAVKSLKNGHSDADMIDLVYEMEIMKLIGSHVNILQLLGCCTQEGELLIITELAQHGNLRDFLRNYLPSSEDELIPNNLTRKTLLLFAQQLAKGMEYLASKRCIHRDLAARNVLVSDNYIMKIADFGLARDIQNKEYYRKKTKGRLPVKWMAPEALSHGRYTAQSDVWSYGIVLWEILTLGATPYPSLQNVDKLFFTLRSGYRLEKPPNCSVETYSLIQKCWSLLPEDRPTFTMIIDDLDNILSDMDDQTPKLSSLYKPDVEQGNPNDEENSVDSESE